MVAHPEEQRFRTIRLLNANFQARHGWCYTTATATLHLNLHLHLHLHLHVYIYTSTHLHITTTLYNVALQLHHHPYTRPLPQATVARHRGGLEVLIALGFIERRSVEDDELCLVLEEPPLELDLDAWSAWFETRKDRDRKIEKRAAYSNPNPNPQPLPRP